MPIYEYKCSECGGISEFLVPSHSASVELACSSCGSLNLERLISAPSFLRGGTNAPGLTCCGREERCEAPPCSTGEACRRR